MKIIDNVIKDYTFMELGTGATFKYGAHYYIKIDELGFGSTCSNAVRLDNGESIYIEDDDKVIPFNCELIVL